MTEDSKPIRNKSFCKNCHDKNWLIECTCGCGEIRFRRDKTGRSKYYINHHQRKGDCSPFWNGGRKKHGKYWMLLMPDYFSSFYTGYVLEHVYFYQEYHKCCMLPWGIVHHIDPVREGYCNNMPWNLEGMTINQHIKLHKTGNQNNKKDMSNRRCMKPDCKTPNETYIDKKGRSMWYGDGIKGWLCSRCRRSIYRKQVLNVIGV